MIAMDDYDAKAAEVDALLARMACKQRAATETVFKTCVPEAPAVAEPFTKAQRDVIGAALAMEREAARQHVEQQLGELRAEIELLRSVVSGKTVELKRDAAA